MAIKNCKVTQVQRSEKYDEIVAEGSKGLEIHAVKYGENYLFEWEKDQTSGEYKGNSRDELIDKVRDNTYLSRIGAEYIIGNVLHHLEPEKDKIELE